MKIFCINAGMKFGESDGKLNSFLADTIHEIAKSGSHEYKRTDVANGYDIAEEVDKHIWADLIITQTPMWWFGAPWTHKKYIDEVMTGCHGKLWLNDGRSSKDASKQYGTGGLSTGKKHLVSITLNAPADAFGDAKQYLFGRTTLGEAVLPINITYKFCGMEILPAFACHDVMKNPNIEEDVVRLKKHLKEFAKV